MILLFPDIYKRAPRICKSCGQVEADWGPYCIDCYLDQEENKQEEKRDEVYETQD